jgi:hypothetical protein
MRLINYVGARLEPMLIVPPSFGGPFTPPPGNGNYI